MRKSIRKIDRYCLLVVQGFSIFSGLFQVIMADPEYGFQYFPNMDHLKDPKSNQTYPTICIFFGQQLNDQRCFSLQDYFSLCEFFICYSLKLDNLWKSHMFDEEETVSNFDSKMKKKLCPIPLIVNKSTSNLHQAHHNHLLNHFIAQHFNKSCISTTLPIQPPQQTYGYPP